jgi:hypothetical protein
MMMNRRAFTANLIAGAGVSLISTRGAAAIPAAVKARTVFLVHGLFADGSRWSEVIARLQAAGLSSTAVQNPLTALPEAVASVQRILDRQDGPARGQTDGRKDDRSEFQPSLPDLPSRRDHAANPGSRRTTRVAPRRR